MSAERAWDEPYLNPAEQDLAALLADKGRLAAMYAEALALFDGADLKRCGKPFPGTVAGDPIVCELTAGHGHAKCYNRELRLAYYPAGD